MRSFIMCISVQHLIYTRISVIFYPHSFVFLRKFDYTQMDQWPAEEWIVKNGQIRPVALLFISSNKKPKDPLLHLCPESVCLLNNALGLTLDRETSNLESCLQGIIFSTSCRGTWRVRPGTQNIEGRFECSPYLTMDRAGGGPVTIHRVVIILRLLQIMLHCFIYLVKCSHFLVLCGR